MIRTAKRNRNIGRKLKREEAENKLAEINKSIEELRKLQNELYTQAKEQEKIIYATRYEEDNPLICLLDCHLNFVIDIVKVILNYLPVDYCPNHMDFYPRRVGCISCLYVDTNKAFHYDLVGAFRISYGVVEDGRYSAKFYNEEDVKFLEYLYMKVKLINRREEDEFIVLTNLPHGMYTPESPEYRLVFGLMDGCTSRRGYEMKLFRPIKK